MKSKKLHNAIYHDYHDGVSRVLFEELDDYRHFLDNELQVNVEAHDEKTANLIQFFLETYDLMLDEVENRIRQLRGRFL